MSLIDTTSSFKIVLLGDTGVGKTSIRRKYFGKGLSNSYLPTLGSDFAIKKVDTYILQIWDLAGQASFKNIRRQYYVGSHGAILIFDLTSEKSFENLNSWINELLAQAGNMIPIVIVGNKLDLTLGKGIRIKKNRIETYIEKLRSRYKYRFVYFDSSAKTGKNIDNIFLELIDEMINL